MSLATHKQAEGGGNNTAQRRHNMFIFKVFARVDRYGYIDSLVEEYSDISTARARADELATILRDKKEHDEIADFLVYIEA